MRTPLLLYGLALAVRLVLIGLYPDPAYPDSYYYVEVARSLAAGHGFTVPFVWIFAEVGNRIPDPAVLPVASNAHWLPLASLVQVPFILLLGPTAFASALPLALISSTAAPLIWAAAKDAGAKPAVAAGAGVLTAMPAAATVFMAQPENFGLMLPLVTLTLWLVARALKGHGWSFAAAGATIGLVGLARNDGVLLFGAMALVWLGDRVRWWIARRSADSVGSAERGSGTPTGTSGPRRPIPVAPALAGAVLFLVVIGPWWLRQLATFGSISPTSSNGAALWIRDIAEWNSLTAHPSLGSWLDQGLASFVASRAGGFASAVMIFSVLVCSVVLVPALVVGAWGRRRSPDLVPWFAYTAVIFAGATLLYPVHVPGGTFIHSAMGLAPYAYVLSLEGVVILVAAVAHRRPSWDAEVAGKVFLTATVVLVAGTGVVFGAGAIADWDRERGPRIALAAEMDRQGIPKDDRVLSVDAAGIHYWTGRPGVVTTNDPLETVEDVARAYGIRWLVLERGSVATSTKPILQGGERPAWVGAPVFTVPDADGGAPRLALYPVCLDTGDVRCAGGARNAQPGQAATP